MIISVRDDFFNIFSQIEHFGCYGKESNSAVRTNSYIW